MPAIMTRAPWMRARTFTQRATVYTRLAATGAVTLLSITGLVCRLVRLPGSQQAASAGDRAAFLARRQLRHDPDYIMPNVARVVIDGETWTVVPNTQRAHESPDGSVIFYRSCDVQRA